MASGVRTLALAIVAIMLISIGSGVVAAKGKPETPPGQEKKIEVPVPVQEQRPETPPGHANRPTVTPSGTTPATPATPAQPNPGQGPATPAIPATPATPATPGEKAEEEPEPPAEQITVVYEEGFDSLEDGVYPPGWGKIYSGRGWGYCEVSNEKSSSPNNSLKMQGKRDWSQAVGWRLPAPPDKTVTYYNYYYGLPPEEYAETVSWLENNPDVWVEVKVMTAAAPSGSRTSPWPMASVGFYKVLPRWGTNYGMVSFYYDEANGVYSIENPAFENSMSYVPETWYTVKIHLDMKTRTFSSWVDGQVLHSERPVDPAEYPEMLVLIAGDLADYTSVWFDDVKIWTVSAAAAPEDDVVDEPPVVMEDDEREELPEMKGRNEEVARRHEALERVLDVHAMIKPLAWAWGRQW